MPIRTACGRGRNSMREKRAQEEIVGFVAVVVLVSVIALIFVTLSFRGPEPSVQDDESMREALESALQYTSNCRIPGMFGQVSLGELFTPCVEQKSCEDGRESCDVLNETLSELLSIGLRVGPERPFKGYAFSASRLTNSSIRDVPEQTIIELQEGNCTGYSRQGTNEFRPSRQAGIIKLELKVCS